LAYACKGVLAVAKRYVLIDSQTDDSFSASEVLQLCVNLCGNSARDVFARPAGDDFRTDSVDGSAGIVGHNGYGGYLLVGVRGRLCRADIVGDGYIKIFGDDEPADEQEEDYQQENDVDNGCHVERGNICLTS